MNKKIAVYTVLSGNYDKIHPIKETLNNKIDAFIISDQARNLPNGWKLKIIKKENQETNIEFNRKFKIQPNLQFDDYYMTIYIDSNIEIISNLESLISDFINSEYDIALYSHPVRNSIYDEAEEIKRIGYDYCFSIDKQVNRYKSEGFISQTLYEANIILRRNTTLMNRTMDLWWYEFSNGIKRDQISLTYACFKTGLKILSLGKHDARFINNNFYYHVHLKKNASRNLKARLFNYVIAKLWY
ncbi:glycosyltransferase domain-containing protein [Providencia huaxiensis]|uniref:DUF616 domain-containing protein n=1 Tax=Providencia rettgeri TaxID=587 RepID=A0AAD2VSA2_PRORE|nr:DUF616 domain-containing protein [Providencia rettgeri]